MLANNPMHKAETRAKVSATLKAMGHQPIERGGNGKPPSKAEEALTLLFHGLGFVAQYPIKTGSRSSDLGELPPCYKPDLANPVLKIALEADVNSHRLLGRRDQDVKTEAALNGLGWTVLRFTNAEILERPGQVVTTVVSTISKLMSSIPTSPTA
jgi:hypothetical protein